MDRNKINNIFNILKSYILFNILKFNTYIFNFLARHKHHKDYIEIPYYHNFNYYAILINKKFLKSPKVVKIEDENGNCITKKIKMYAGPQHNFHNHKITPKLLGYTKIKIFYIDENIKIIENDENINLYNN